LQQVSRLDVVIPAAKLVVDRAARGQILGQGRPLAAGRENIHHVINDVAHDNRAAVPTELGRWDQRLNQRPFLVGQVAGITQVAVVVQGKRLGDVAERRPNAAVIVPPHRTVVLRHDAATAPKQRDRHLRCIAEAGRMSWRNDSGYNRCAEVEAAIGQWNR
jgi:glutathione S-transferase